MAARGPSTLTHRPKLAGQPPGEAPLEHEDDPLVGDDEPWAEEDWATTQRADAEAGSHTEVTFFRMLAVVCVASVALWAALGATAVAIYRLLT